MGDSQEESDIDNGASQKSGEEDRSNASLPVDANLGGRQSTRATCGRGCGKQKAKKRKRGAAEQAPAAEAPGPSTAAQKKPTREEVHKEALDILLQMEIPAAKAARALEAVEEQDAKLAEDALTWADEAMVWCACDNEVAEEVEQMGQAMQISLEQHEEQKAQEKHVHEYTLEEILKKFEMSHILKKDSNHEILHLPPKHPAQLVFRDYLVFESRCLRWYPISEYFFAEEAEAIAGEVAKDTKGNGLADFIRTRLQQLQDHVFSRPETEDAAAVPTPFKEAAPKDHFVAELIEIE